MSIFRSHSKAILQRPFLTCNLSLSTSVFHVLIGKTTLAHILARHAGYDPLEINASDDRSESVLYDKIRSATEMQSVSGGRPNCLILDEIDGAMGAGGTGEDTGAIHALIRIVEAKSRAEKEREKGAAKEEGEDNDMEDDVGTSKGSKKSVRNTRLGVVSLFSSSHI